MAVTIDVKLKPRAAKRAFKVCGHKSIEVSVTAPPVDNRANEMLIEYLSDALGVAKSSVSIIKGGHNRNKVVSIENLENADIDEILKQLTFRDA
jgi:uncharacterized protein (TIGR00251 family)